MREQAPARFGSNRLPALLGGPRNYLIRLLKRRGRPAINGFLARYSLVGDPAIFENGQFPWARTLELGWKTIREEAERLLAVKAEISSFQEISPDQYRISRDAEWKTFWYRGFGYRSELFARLCPETARLVDTVPSVETVFFSILSRGQHIIAHRGVFKGIINYHLGVIVPQEREKCRIRVGDESFFWEEGKSRIFDDTNEHEVWNDTNEDRVVLMIQFRRPLRTPGRQVRDLFLAALALTPYVKVAKRNQIAFERRFEEVLRRGSFEAR